MGSPGSKITADFQGGDSKALCKYQVEGPGTVTSWCSSRGHTLFPASRCPAPARSPSRAVLPPRNLVPAAHTRFRLFRSPKAWVGPSIRGFPVNVGAGVCQQLRLGALARTHAHTRAQTPTCTCTRAHTHSTLTHTPACTRTHTPILTLPTHMCTAAARRLQPPALSWKPRPRMDGAGQQLPVHRWGATHPSGGPANGETDVRGHGVRCRGQASNSRVTESPQRLTAPPPPSPNPGAVPPALQVEIFASDSALERVSYVSF